MYAHPNKLFVRVKAEFTGDGRVKPLALIWEDGTEYEIDRASTPTRAASMKAGGTGMRYTIRVHGQERYIWRDEDRWYVERKD